MYKGSREGEFTSNIAEVFVISARCQYRDPVILATRGWNPSVKLSVLIGSLESETCYTEPSSAILAYTSPNPMTTMM